MLVNPFGQLLDALLNIEFLNLALGLLFRCLPLRRRKPLQFGQHTQLKAFDPLVDAVVFGDRVMAEKPPRGRAAGA